MAISQQALKNIEFLFPSGQSELLRTDPDLVEIFANFAFDEVLRESLLPQRIRLMVQLAALIGTGAHTEFQVMLEAAASAGVTPVEMKEVVYQAVPYVGLGRVIDFVHLLNERLQAGGVALPLPSQATTTAADRLAKGLALQKAVAGAEVIEAMQASAPADLTHVQRFLSGNCFGDHVSRAGLDIATRELVTLALLASLGGCDLQLQGHVAINVKVGNDRGVMIDVVTQILPFIGYPRALNALRGIQEKAPAHG